MRRTARAIQLMILFGVEDALVGDIQEQASCSSRPALWMQSTGAILLTMFKDCGTHWLIVSRAILFGMLIWKGVLPFIAVLLWRLYGFFGLGALIGLTHPGLHASTIAVTFLAIPAAVGMGWSIARLHPTRTPMPVIAFLIAACLTWLSPYARQLSNAVGDPRFRPYLLTQTVGICVFMVSVLAGGLWQAWRASER